jgi:hypothetical protein
MALSDLWLKSPEQLEGKRVQQIIAFAGAGQLRDGGPASCEFREFLSRVPSSILARYADECLQGSFTESGFALQDIINQVGRRLGYFVVDGRYRGTTTHVGFDGSWKFPDGHTLIVEVKTTDAYRIDLERIANYRRELIAEGGATEERSSMLIVVGREDTGDLEAQIRGSRHAWDIRLISVDHLLRLMSVKERLDNPATIRRISDILIPREFTRLDEIVDIVFSTTEEAAEEEAEEHAETPEEERAAPAAFHDACMARIQRHFGTQLVRQTRSGYAIPDGQLAVVCAVSKTHHVVGHPSFWFAFHPYQKSFLDGASESFLVLGCGSPEVILLIPKAELEKWLPDMWTTERSDTFYWHVRIHDENGKYYWDRKKGAGQIDVTPYLLPESRSGSAASVVEGARSAE